MRADAESECKLTNENRVRLIRGDIAALWKTQTCFSITDEHKLLVREVEKRWGFCFDKRLIVKRSEHYYDTLPFGY